MFIYALTNFILKHFVVSIYAPTNFFNDFIIVFYAPTNLFTDFMIVVYFMTYFIVGFLAYLICISAIKTYHII
jgi:hypothetical protein